MQNRRISVDKVCVSGIADRGDVSSRRRVCKQTSVDCSLAARAVLPILMLMLLMLLLLQSATIAADNTRVCMHLGWRVA